MNCPVCQSAMRVTNTYAADQGGKMQRLCCTNQKCNTVAVAQTLIVLVNPPRGQGASTLARLPADSIRQLQQAQKPA